MTSPSFAGSRRDGGPELPATAAYWGWLVFPKEILRSRRSVRPLRLEALAKTLRAEAKSRWPGKEPRALTRDQGGFLRCRENASGAFGAGSRVCCQSGRRDADGPTCLIVSFEA